MELVLDLLHRVIVWIECTGNPGAGDHECNRYTEVYKSFKISFHHNLRCVWAEIFINWLVSSTRGTRAHLLIDASSILNCNFLFCCWFCCFCFVLHFVLGFCISHRIVPVCLRHTCKPCDDTITHYLE